MPVHREAQASTTIMAHALHQGAHAFNDAELARRLPGALRTVFNIFDSWGLTDGQGRTLLGVPRSTYDRWKRDPARARLTPDLVERLSYILGIRKALEILEPGEEKGRVESGWLGRPNDEPMFGGRPPLERMLSGHMGDLYEVRRYLDGQRGW